ncbi:hypothetical protein [Propionivibrio sp.]|uniref:hypothetical protein n=1 Tax=Propionivibrio sp. TaxID=2212460 RepID=UPI003BF159CE
MSSTTREVTLTLDLGELGENDVDFTVKYSAGCAESGRFGNSENYDPGCDSDIELVSAIVKGVNILPLFPDWDSVTERIKDILDNEEPEFNAPEDYRDAA